MKTSYLLYQPIIYNNMMQSINDTVNGNTKKTTDRREYMRIYQSTNHKKITLSRRIQRQGKYAFHIKYKFFEHFSLGKNKSELII